MNHKQDDQYEAFMNDTGDGWAAPIGPSGTDLGQYNPSYYNEAVYGDRFETYGGLEE